MKNTEKKDERIYTRVPTELKKQLAASAEKQGKTCSDYLRDLIIQEISHTPDTPADKQNAQPLSHEQMVENSLKENYFITKLLTNKEFSNKDKKIIGRELKNYV